MYEKYASIVSKLPLTEIWNENGVISADKIRDLSAADIIGLFRAGKVLFVIANVGSDLRWIPVEEVYDFWKSELKDHVAEPGGSVYLENFHGEYCYFATEWKCDVSDPIILFTMAH